MLKNIALLIIAISFLACSKNDSPAPTPKAFNSKDAKLVVSSKSCGESALPESTERILLDGDFLIHVSILSEDETTFCLKGKVYARVIKSFAAESGHYHEESLLKPEETEIQCFDKRSNQKISAKKEPLIENVEQKLQISIEPDFGSIHWTNHKDCPNDVLTYYVTPKV